VLHAQLARQVARGNLAIAVHQHDQPFFLLVLQYDGFNDLVFGYAEQRGKLRRTAVFFISIDIWFKINLPPAQKTDGRGNGMVGFAHKRPFRRPAFTAQPPVI